MVAARIFKYGGRESEDLRRLSPKLTTAGSTTPDGFFFHNEKIAGSVRKKPRDLYEKNLGIWKKKLKNYLDFMWNSAENRHSFFSDGTAENICVRNAMENNLDFMCNFAENRHSIFPDETAETFGPKVLVCEM